jgi:phospholipid/cholesterol/gamma-HCH transport system substrate-binding protein
METRANHVLIGVFATMVVLAGFGFIMWLSHLQLHKDVKLYDIIFRGTVSGVGPGADVRYMGLKYGQVRFIHLKPDDPSKVLVRIELNAEAPVTVDTVATVESLSLTGVSAVNLSGTKPGGALLVAKNGEPYPVIPSKASNIENLLGGVPALVANANTAIDKLNIILSDDNTVAIHNILKNTEVMTQAFATSGPKVESFFNNADQAARNLNKFSTQLDAMGNDLHEISKQAAELVSSATRVTTELEGIEQDNRAALADFTHNGLGEITRFATEARSLVRSLDRIADRLDSDPQSIIYGPGATKETKLK